MGQALHSGQAFIRLGGSSVHPRYRLIRGILGQRIADQGFSQRTNLALCLRRSLLGGIGTSGKSGSPPAKKAARDQRRDRQHGEDASQHG